jgi:hypothetical protein
MTNEDVDNWWVCTTELHFVERIGDGVTVLNGEVAHFGRRVLVLQQKWEQHFRSEMGMLFERPVEWRDVPIESNPLGLASLYATVKLPEGGS